MDIDNRSSLSQRKDQRYTGHPDITHLLHFLRGEKLAEMPQGINRLVSVGCSGTWYFNWINSKYGPLKNHIGVEFYMPKPDDLPEGVDWISNSAGSIPDIADGSADALFSGQNLEHLWPEEMIGFFLESYRILQHGGLLIIDSPNRRITERLNWSHPEHTVELTVSEVQKICQLAGFTVSKCKGIWLCEDPSSGKLMELDRMEPVGAWSVNRRCSEAEDYPESSFIWWVEARKSHRQPKPDDLKSAMLEIFSHAWPERCQRMQTIVAQRDGQWFHSMMQPGVIMFGPYMPLPPGNYEVLIHLRCDPKQISPDKNLGKCDVVSTSSSHPICELVIVNPAHDGDGYFACSLIFTLSSMTFGLQYRVIGEAGISLSVCREVDLHSSTDLVYSLSVRAASC